MPPPIEFSGLSETGPVREDNQDTYWLPGFSFPDVGALFLLADGMGGYAQGGVAAETVVREMFKTVSGAGPDAPQNGAAAGLLRKGVIAANTAVVNTAARMGIHRMGSTLEAAWLVGDQLHIAHVGDSRVYLLHKSTQGASHNPSLRCLTSDHSVAGDLLRAKVIGPDQVRGHARRSHLTRAIGIGLFVQPDLITCPVEPGDRLLLCTDGLWAAIEDAEIAEIASACDRMDQLCRLLVDRAYQNGSDDNASVIAVRINEVDKTEQKKSGWRPWWKK